jgi:signal transduction histidine kinase
VSSISFLRSAAFRLAAGFALAFVISSLLLFAFIYWQTAIYETDRVERFIVREAEIIAAAPRSEVLWAVQMRLTKDVHRLSFAALFDQDGKLVAGNLQHIPADLPADGRAHRVSAAPIDLAQMRPEVVIAVARRLPDNSVVVIGRNIDQLSNLTDIVGRALLLGVIPAVLLALGAGVWLSGRAQRRVKEVTQTVERIMQGDLRERLPLRGAGDDFDRLVGDMQDVGNSIAHDLRTPLARVRAKLERGRDAASTHEELQAVVDRAIIGLDQALAIIVALLRIGEIEGGQRRAAFTDVDLTDILHEVADLYAPMAEEKQIDFAVTAQPVPLVHGDRELLMEVVANLVDNAIKFTAEGGRVALELLAEAAGPLLRVIDSGPGIPPEERQAVMRRFYRLDKSRHVQGSGLGLSLVGAILRLHDFTIRIDDARPGCVFEVRCYAASRTARMAGVPKLEGAVEPVVLPHSLAGIARHS